MVFRYYGQDTYVDPPLAQSASGEMLLHGPVVPGQPLEGFIDCTMMGIGQSGCGLAFGEDCNPCFEQACCAQGAACGDSDNCLAFVACWSDCPSGDAACDNGCAAAYPQGSELFAAVLGCLNQNCEAQCFRWGHADRRSPWQAGPSSIIAVGELKNLAVVGSPRIGAHDLHRPRVHDHLVGVGRGGRTLQQEVRVRGDPDTLQLEVVLP